MTESRPSDAPDPDELGEETPDDQRGAAPPAEGAEPDPEPGEDPGPFGNPAQDEEGLGHQQQDAD
jgi:hypothetical protein